MIWVTIKNAHCLECELHYEYDMRRLLCHCTHATRGTWYQQVHLSLIVTARFGEKKVNTRITHSQEQKRNRISNDFELWERLRMIPRLYWALLAIISYCFLGWKQQWKEGRVATLQLSKRPRWITWIEHQKKLSQAILEPSEVLEGVYRLDLL